MKMLPPLAALRQRVVMPRLNRPDLWLLIATAGLVGLGIVMVFNASYFYAQDRYGDPFVFFRKQLFALGCGAAGPKIRSQLDPGIPNSVVPDLSTAVREAAVLAGPGDIILLSPGCASFDEFTDYAARGRRFRELVEAL